MGGAAPFGGLGCYQRSMSRARKAVAAAALTLAAITMLPAAAPPAAAARPSKEAYRGPGTWIDIFDSRVLADPFATVEDLSLHGIRTIYVETANYTNPRQASIANPVGIAALIDAAHANGMRVVAWYLPGFKNMTRDLRRSIDAINFTTVAGGHFDSFALDIESNAVHSTSLRNRRAQKLSSRIRRAVGKQYPLGAIVPDQRSTSVSLPSVWPRFPYRRLRKYYDVFLPMAYSTYRGKGATFVYGYTTANVQYVRLMTGDRSLPVHVIGGLANKLRASEDAAAVRAAREQGVLGASFYKLRLSGEEEWQALQLGFSP
jgi:uncharacterized lipoprotein YddW (UPF0748 family)